MAQDEDFYEVKRCKGHISNDTQKTTKKSTKPVPTSTAVKLSPKLVLNHNFFATLKTTETENTLLEQKALIKPGRPPPVVMTSTKNLIQFKSYLKD